jgi:CPA2 family monovalent cation:H+ antiporter-2
MPVLLPDLTLLFALAVVAAMVCQWLKLPMPIGLLLVGALAGPSALGLVQDTHSIEVLSEIGVVLLLFVIGLEFSLGDLVALRRPFLLGGSLQFLGTAGLVAVGTTLLGASPAQGVFLGFVVALSSTAIVLRLLQERAELDAPHGRTILAILIFQDIAVVPVMLTAPLLAGNGGGLGLPVVGSLVLRVVAMAVFAYTAWRWLVPFLLERITRTRNPEAFLLGVVVLCIGIALLTQAMGLSLALGAFLAGLIVSESRYSHQAVAVMLPFRDVFMSLFFVSIGMLLNFRFVVENPLLLLALTLGVLFIKPVLGAVSALVVGLPLRSSVLCGMALGQVGEFSLVAAKVGVGAGLLGQDVFQIVLNLAVLSMLLTPILMAVGPRLSRFLVRTPLIRLERKMPGPSLAEGPVEGCTGHILIIGFGVTGRNLARTAKLAGVPYAILEMNGATVRDAAEEGEPIHYGDATHVTILNHVGAPKARAIVVVINDPAGARRIVELARRVAPDAYLLVRSRYLKEVEPLLALGADEVIADELEVSVEVFSRVLSRMLIPRDEIKQLIGEVRGEWRRMARSFDKGATQVPVHHIRVPDMATHSLRIGDDSPLAGRTIATCGLREEHGVSVLAITRDGVTQGNPDSADVLRPGDVLFVIGPKDWEPVEVA